VKFLALIDGEDSRCEIVVSGRARILEETRRRLADPQRPQRSNFD